MGNPWIGFVRAFAKENNLFDGCAISEAGVAYRYMKKGGFKERKRRKKDDDGGRL